MSEPEHAFGDQLREWEALFRPGIQEFAASAFRFTRENTHLVRIAFGNNGPCVDAAGNRHPVYTHAVTLPPDLALQLADLLLKHYSAPEVAKGGSTGSEP